MIKIANHAKTYLGQLNLFGEDEAALLHVEQLKLTRSNANAKFAHSCQRRGLLCRSCGRLYLTAMLAHTKQGDILDPESVGGRSLFNLICNKRNVHMCPRSFRIRRLSTSCKCILEIHGIRWR